MKKGIVIVLALLLFANPVMATSSYPFEPYDELDEWHEEIVGSGAWSNQFADFEHDTEFELDEYVEYTMHPLDYLIFVELYFGHLEDRETIDILDAEFMDRMNEDQTAFVDDTIYYLFLGKAHRAVQHGGVIPNISWSGDSGPVYSIVGFAPTFRSRVRNGRYWAAHHEHLTWKQIQHRGQREILRYGHWQGFSEEPPASPRSYPFESTNVSNWYPYLGNDLTGLDNIRRSPHGVSTRNGTGDGYWIVKNEVDLCIKLDFDAPRTILSPNDPYLEQHTPREGNLLRPTDEPHGWEYLSRFGTDNVPAVKDMQELIAMYNSVAEPDGYYEDRSKMFYVMRRDNNNVIHVDLLYAGMSAPFLDPDKQVRWDPPSINLQFKASRLWGLLGGYYQGKVVGFHNDVAEIYWTVPGRALISQYRKHNQLIAYKIPKGHDVLKFGPFVPDLQGDSPPVVVPPGDVPDPYDPEYEEEVVYPDWLQSIFDGLKSLFVPSSLSFDGFITNGNELYRGVLNIVDRFRDMVDFEDHDVLPETIVLWGHPFFGPMNDIFGQEVYIPFLNMHLSVYGISRMVATVSLAYVCIRSVNSAIASFYGGGGDDE